MTDTKCPHCGADADEFGNGKWFDCGSLVGQQSIICEVRTLRAKVAAQQELLRGARRLLCWIGNTDADRIVERIDAMIAD